MKRRGDTTFSRSSLGSIAYEHGVLESKQKRTTTLENSHQSYEHVKKREKTRTQDLTRFNYLPTSSG